tara:strand:+ start:197 stop:598 length:402 start_codon:yes stop_codon:yes gene_type:complete
MLKLSLALSTKWDENMGIESHEIAAKSLMKYKKYIVDVYTYDDIPEDEEYVNFYGSEMLWVTGITEQKLWNESVDKKFELNIYKIYTFNDRIFGIESHAFKSFISRVKKYYSEKLKFYKNPRNILLRQLTGFY